LKKLAFFLLISVLWAELNTDKYKPVTIIEFLGQIKTPSNLKKTKSRLFKNDYRYDFKIYADANVRTGRDITDNYKASTEFTEESAKIHLDKLIYDGVNDYIYKYTAKIKKLNNLNKNQKILSAVTVYSDLLTSQNRISLIKKILQTKLDIYKYNMKRYQKGVITKIALIDSKAALLNEKERLIDEYSRYYALEIIIKNLIGDESKKLLYPLPFKCEVPDNIKKTIPSNPFENHSNYRYKENESFPIKIDFYSFAGYTVSSNRVFNFKNDYNSANWEVGINFYVPIFDREYERDKELSKLDFLENVANAKKEYKNLVMEINRLLNSISFNRQKLKTLKEKIDLFSEKTDTYAQRVKKGTEEFIDYKNSQIELYEEMIKYYDVLFDMNKKCAKLKILTGRELE